MAPAIGNTFRSARCPLPTWYDYRTRFGLAGRLLDQVLFRPLIGWATAWSFDRLRLWMDRGIPPEVSMRLTLIHASARLGIAFTWLWQGLVPKLLFPSLDEQAMMVAAGFPIKLVPLAGMLELMFAAVTLALWRWRPWFLLNALAMVAALSAVALQSPQYLLGAFNPVTLNGGMILISIIGYLAGAELPSSSRCLRRAPKVPV